MRHVWLAVALLVAAGSEVEAKRVFCSCPDMVIVPARGATGLPINTKVWVLKAGAHSVTMTDGAVIADFERFEPSLEPGVTYTNEGYMVSFTPTAERDDTPPAAPQGIYVSIVTNPEDNLEALSLHGRYDPETAVVRVSITDRNGTQHLVTTPARLFVCQPRLHITPGEATVSIRSIDVAGNESPAFTTTVTVTKVAGTDPDTQCDGRQLREHHHHRGHGFEILFLILLYPIALIAWLVIVGIRRATIKRHLSEPISLLTAEVVVRRLLRWQLIWTVIVIGATFAVVMKVDDDFWILLAPFLISTFGQLFLQRRALTLLDRPETDAARRGPWLVVTSLKDSVTVRASDSDFVVAKKRAIPTSVVK